MDETFDMHMPELPDTPETATVVPNSEVSILGDPLSQMLGKLESSIEQPVLGSYPDPLSNTLDDLEASIEQQRPIIDSSPDPINETLSQLEKRIESHYSVVSNNADVLQETPPVQGSFSQVNSLSHPPLITPKKPQVFKRVSFLHRHRVPIHRMRGHSTGIRNSINPFDWYCYRYDEWVSKEECGDCPDFEETDYAPDNEDGRCKHSFSSSVCEDEKEDEPTEMDSTK
jgi:hypothetical protein